MGNYSNMLKSRVLTRGPKVGYCAICRSHGSLTRDHVPPKGCGNVKDVILKTLTLDTLPEQKVSKTHSQGGVHYLTVCSNCNNNLLGQKYDPALNSLYNEVISRAQSAQQNRIRLPAYSHHFIQPHKLARAVIGHLLAANSVGITSGNWNDSPFYDALRKYFLDETEDLPNKLEIYYWLYPYRTIKVLRGLGKMSLDWEGNIFGDIIKFAPFGFWLVWDQPKGLSTTLEKLIPRRGIEFDERIQIKFDYRKIPPESFPEAPADKEMLLFADTATSIASPKTSNQG